MAATGTLNAVWHYPNTVYFGPGSIGRLPKVCQRLGISKPLLVTDPTLAALPMVADAVAANEAAGLPTGVYGAVKGNPVGANVVDGAAQFRDGGHDGVIAFGGGSSLDAGKAIAFMAAQREGTWQDYVLGGARRKDANTKDVPKIVAVPTTAGTGSEVGRAAVIVDEATETKVILLDPVIMPAAVIADPELTLGLPPHVTAATGMDALAHCLEAYCALDYHPMADGIAVEGMRLVKEWLPVAYREGSNVEARANMLAAASMGATAFQKGLGAIHALSHPVGAVYDTHHGLTNAVFMPYVLLFNRAAVEDKMTRLAAYLGLESPSFEAIMDWVLRLRETLKIPHTLAELGVAGDRLDDLAAMAAVDPCAAENPVRAGVPEMKRMLGDAMDGRLR